MQRSSLAIILCLSTFPALGQTVPGRFPANTVYGNPTGAEAQPSTPTLTVLFDSAFCGTNGQIIQRVAGAWACASTVTGTVTSVGSGTGLTGGPITGTGTLSFATIANNTVLGNVSGGVAVPIALTGTQQTTMCDTFATAATTKGCVPGSNSAGATAFLNATGGWAAPNIPTWTTAGRPTPTTGVTGYNSTLGVVEYYDGANWTAVRSALAHVKYIVGNWYLSETAGIGIAGTATGASVIKCTYDEIITPVTISDLGVQVTTAGTNIQLAMYSATNGRPGTLIANTGSFGVTPAAAYSGPINNPGGITSVQVGWGTPNGKDIWLCFNHDNAAMVLGSKTIGTFFGPGRIGSATLANVTSPTSAVQALHCTGAACTGGSSTFGTWPASLVGTTWTEILPQAAMRAAFKVVSSP